MHELRALRIDCFDQPTSQQIWLRCSAGHDVASFLRFAAAVIMIHAQVMAHLMSHDSGEIRKPFVTKLWKQSAWSGLIFFITSNQSYQGSPFTSYNAPMWNILQKDLVFFPVHCLIEFAHNISVSCDRVQPVWQLFYSKLDARSWPSLNYANSIRFQIMAFVNKATVSARGKS